MKDLKQFICSLFDGNFAISSIGKYIAPAAALVFVFSADAQGQTTAPQITADQEMRAIDNLLREVNEPVTAPSTAAAVPSLTVAQATMPTAQKQAGSESVLPVQEQSTVLPLPEQQGSVSAVSTANAANTAPLPMAHAINTDPIPLDPSSANQNVAKAPEQSSGQTSPAAATPQTSNKPQAPASFLEEVIESNKGSDGIWKNLGAAFGLLILISLVVYQYTRSRASGQTKPGRAPKALQLVATLPISPKRQVLLIRVRDTEIAVAATEHGLSLLSEVKENNAQAIESLTAAKTERTLRPLSMPESAESIPTRMISSSTQETKSEILKKALESIENKRAKQSRISANDSEYSAPAARESRQTVRGTSPAPAETPATPTMPTQGTPRLKKFFANSYKQSNERESDRDQQATPTRSTNRSEANNAPSEETGPSQTDNVAQLIRDKLKQMRAIN